MNKKQLKQEMKAIQDQYEAVEPKNSNLLNRSCIEPYVQCMNNPDLRTHLLETELAPSEEDVEFLIDDYSTAEDIIESFQSAIDAVEELGLLQEKENPELIKKEKKYREYMSASLVGDASNGAAVAINQLHDHITFTNDEVKIKGLDSTVINKAILKQEEMLKRGDLTSLESMLHSQVHTLNAMFTTLVGKMNYFNQIEQIGAFGKLALKAQNQCRQSISTLAEVKGIKKATFIHQLNNAHNQQVNNGAEENISNQPNEKVINDVDRGSKAAREGQNQANEAMAIQDTRGEQTLCNELIQARDEVCQDDRVAETVSSVKQTGTRG